MASIHLPPVLTEFVRAFPGIAVTVRELTSKDLYEALREKEVDFAVGPQTDDEDFACTTVMVEPLQALIPDHFLDRPRDSITMAELVTMPVLVQTKATAVRRLLDAAVAARGLAMETPYQFIQAETIVAMAEAGLGVAVQPSSRLERATLRSSRIVSLVDPSVMRSMALITLRNQRLSPAAKSLADKIVRDVRAMTNFEIEAAKLSQTERAGLLSDF